MLDRLQVFISKCINTLYALVGWNGIASKELLKKLVKSCARQALQCWPQGHKGRGHQGVEDVWLNMKKIMQSSWSVMCVLCVCVNLYFNGKHSFDVFISCYIVGLFLMFSVHAWMWFICVLLNVCSKCGVRVMTRTTSVSLWTSMSSSSLTTVLISSIASAPSSSRYQSTFLLSDTGGQFVA